jgi:L-2-hydroxycarboxylate dehydrogenase (NAD+)
MWRSAERICVVMIGEAPSPIRAREADEHDFIVRALRAVNVSESDANDVANVLVAADLRGVESHGIARLDLFYVRRIEAGVVNARPNYVALSDRPAQFALDAGNGLGHPAGIFAMRKAIEKARERGLAFATVRNSNHYGIAAYYAMLALDAGLIGLSMTNSTHLAVPTFGRQKTQGTNPIAVAIPAAGHPPFVLDMATTGVTFGRLEVSDRKGKPLKPGWAVDAEGRETLDPALAMTKGALLPLGGYGTENGGHKGYGLGALVEILCGVLSGGMFGTALGLDERGLHGGTVGHFFGAFRIDALRDGAGFQRDLARELQSFEQSAPAPGAERVITPGEPERAFTERYRSEGVPIDPKVWEGIDAMADRLGIAKLERFTVG